MSAKRGPDIFRYHDFRTFLKAWVSFLKTEKKISTRQIAKDAGVAVGYMTGFFKGEFLMTEQALSKIAPHLMLKGTELSYLKALRDISESPSPQARLAALQRVQRILAYSKINPDQIHLYKYLTHWYYVAIREMVGLEGFKLEAKWIRPRLRFPVSTREVETAIEFLTDNGFILFDKHGRPHLGKDPLDCMDGFYKVAFHQFHSQLLDLQKKSLLDIPSNERHFTGFSVAIRSQEYSKMVSILEEARLKLNQMASAGDDSSDVYYFSFNALPLASKVKGGSKDEG